FCIICYIICLNNKIMFSILGKFLTPILLVLLTILIVVGFSQSQNIETNIQAFSNNFIDGFFHGYSTMDLFASFFFSSLIFKQIESIAIASGENSDTKSIIKAALGPSIFGALLLSLIYFGFVYLGSHY